MQESSKYSRLCFHSGTHANHAAGQPRKLQQSAHPPRLSTDAILSQVVHLLHRSNRLQGLCSHVLVLSTPCTCMMSVTPHCHACRPAFASWTLHWTLRRRFQHRLLSSSASESGSRRLAMGRATLAKLLFLWLNNVHVVNLTVVHFTVK